MKKFFYPLVKDPYRNKDIQAAIKVVKSHKLNAGNQTIKFQNIFKKKIKVNNAIMVNSGSSANLLALQCIINPYRRKRLKSGDEVLIPSLCWSTSLWPIIQSGLKPKFIDIDKSTLNLNLNDLESKISKKTKAILIVHVLGNTTNMDRLMKIKKKYNLILIEDTCESLGTKYGKKYLGTFGEISTFSFYASHQISSGEGGMVCCNSTEDAEIIKALRAHGWSRGLKNENKKDSQYIPAKTYLFTQWLCGSLISIVLFFALGGEIEPLNSSANLRLMGLVFIDIFNYSLFFYTIKRLSATFTTMVDYVVPITGITLGYIFLDEIVNNVFYPTLLLIFVSLYLAVKDEANNLS